ncbi:hypothetical protein EVAR_58095_1 [Eumeta japonica]|uniref:Uncharacterized protein n=1 Tax=Eumeta variegata TaxID=151549 RepID=A0A4C1YPN2_EUMVA|nr:hypothetical protein EVAR_58095_1 [Eumeta japonica]
MAPCGDAGSLCRHTARRRTDGRPPHPIAGVATAHDDLRDVVLRGAKISIPNDARSAIAISFKWSVPPLTPRRGANEQASHQRVGCQGRPWTLAIPEESQCVAGLLEGNRIYNGQKKEKQEWAPEL